MITVSTCDKLITYKVGIEKLFFKRIMIIKTSLLPYDCKLNTTSHHCIQFSTAHDLLLYNSMTNLILVN